jgi:pseudaminic acid cytidylyltransferase
MSKNNNAICIIPARGGSKRIPRKNIKLFHGKPLIAYSIEVALASGVFSDVFVSTDDEEIAQIAKEYGAKVPFMRSAKLSDDFTSSGDAVNDTVKRLQELGEVFDYVCTIYATAPLLEKKYLLEGFKQLKKSDARMAFSVTSMPFPIQRTFRITQEGRCEMFTPEYFSKRSQDLEDAYQDAGQFYWEKVGVEAKDIPFGSEAIPVVLPRHLVQDIDTPEDWQRAELLYATLHKDRFDEWNRLKKTLHNKKKIIKFSNGNIYFMSIGENIGHEVYGKDELFLRPVLVYKKLSSTTFLGIPLTSQKKEGSYYFSFNYKKDKTSTAMLHQMRVFDIRRSEYLSGHINKNIYRNLQNKVEEFMKLPQSKAKGNGQRGLNR